MSDNHVTTENKILNAANSVFLLYGYHGATLQQVADLAGVHKSAIHYYFRSKEKLYGNVVVNVLDGILKSDNKLIANNEITEQQKWFLLTEFYNNEELLEKTLKELYSNDWRNKLNAVKEMFKDKVSF